jgi:hypothetical protein
MSKIPLVRTWDCWRLPDGQLWAVGPTSEEIMGVSPNEFAARALCALPVAMNAISRTGARLEALSRALALSGHSQSAVEVADILQDLALEVMTSDPRGVPHV